MSELKPVSLAGHRLNNPNIVEDGKATRWQPGQSGNPKGGPKKELSITMLVRQILEENEGAGYKDVAERIVSIMTGRKAGEVLAILDQGYAQVLRDTQDRLEG